MTQIPKIGVEQNLLEVDVRPHLSPHPIMSPGMLPFLLCLSRADGSLERK